MNRVVEQPWRVCKAGHPSRCCVRGLHTESISATILAEYISRKYTGNPTGSSTASGLFHTASFHRLAETCAARLWAMLRLGHARTDQRTGQQDREKFCSLPATQNVSRLRAQRSVEGSDSLYCLGYRHLGLRLGSRQGIDLFSFFLTLGATIHT